MDFLQLAEQRYSVRSFAQRPVEQEKVDRILRAGQVAPTARNWQPQRVFVLQSQAALERLKRCTECSYNAPLALLTCVDTEVCWKRTYDGKSSGDVDGAIVMTHMMLEAEEQGIGSTWVMYFDPEATRREFSLPDRYEPVGFLVMGYPADDAAPSPRHSERKALSDTVTTW